MSLLSHSTLIGQGYQTYFGQNRVQLKDFDWTYYESDNFIVYSYPGGQNIAKFVTLAAEEELSYLENLMDYSSPDKIDIIVYNTIEDLAQTNVGIYENIYNIGGTNSVLGSKIYVYFNGNHRDLINELRKSIMSLLIDAMMVGSGLQEILDVIISFDLPEWYKPGLLAYHSKDWEAEEENALRTFFATNKKAYFKNLSRNNPQLAGHALFNYISKKYGHESIRNLVYLTRINRNINSGIAYALDITLERLIIDWELEMSKKFKTEELQIPDERFKVSFKTRKNRTYDQIKTAPNGELLSYVLRQDGFYKVFITPTEKSKIKKIGKGGIRSDSYPFDLSTPITAWERSSKQFALFQEKKDYVKLTIYDIETKKKTSIPIRGFQKIFSANYINPNTLVFSAQRSGYSDIFTYNISNSRTVNITNDFYDDLDAGYIELGEKRGIIFASNRIDDTLRREGLNKILPTGTFDLFFHDLEKPNSPTLTRLTQSPLSNERNPVQADSGRFAFLGNQNGIDNIYYGYIDSFFMGTQTVLVTQSKDTLINPSKLVLDSLSNETDTLYNIRKYKQKGITYPVTDFSIGIENMSTTRMGQHYLVSINNKNRTESFKIPLSALQDQKTLKNKDFVNNETEKRKKNPNQTASFEQSIEIDNVNFDSIYQQPFRYTFESKFNNFLGLKDTAKVSNEEVVVEEIIDYDNQTLVSTRTLRSSRTIPYRARFSSKSFSTQLDNAIRITPYQNVSTASPNFNYPSLGGFFSYHLHDVMEDHNIIAGFKIPFNFNGTELFVKYDNLKKRIDKSILFYRKGELENISYFDNNTNFFIGNGQGRVQTYYVEGAVTYPFDVIRSLRLSTAYRNDRLIPLTNDDAGAGLLAPNRKDNWISTKLEYIHDNSREPVLNLPLGLKYKVFFEYFQNANTLSSNTFNLGWDFRFYQKIWRNVIFAARFAGASSFGNKKILYFLGGVDSWLNQSVNNDIPVLPNVEYSFMALANNMRGFQQNIRNGNGFSLLNLEIRAAIFSSIAKKNINSAFIRNFQFIGFMDIGSAYRGLTPFNEDNPFTEEDIPLVGPVEVTARYFRNPTVMSFGTGARTTLLGYFIKMDVGWGYDGRIVSRKPRLDFSISKDF